MELENQVCSLELAKQLKELGVKQESYAWWSEILSTENGWYWRVLTGGGQGKDYCSAFTVAELGEILPSETLLTGRRNGHWRIMSWGAFSEVEDRRFDDIKPSAFESNTEADARAKMLIYFIKNKFVDAAAL